MNKTEEIEKEFNTIIKDIQIAGNHVSDAYFRKCSPEYQKEVRSIINHLNGKITEAYLELSELRDKCVLKHELDARFTRAPQKRSPASKRETTRKTSRKTH